jgi:hypothetical protein
VAHGFWIDIFEIIGLLIKAEEAFFQKKNARPTQEQTPHPFFFSAELTPPSAFVLLLLCMFGVDLFSGYKRLHRHPARLLA